MNDVVYPVVLTYEEDIIYASIPDLSDQEHLTFGSDLNEIINNTKEVLTLLYMDYEGEKPKASDIKVLRKKILKNQEVIYVSVWLPYEMSLVKDVFIKKTLTIPSYLDILAKNKNLNFSQILQKALKKELGIKNT